MAILSRNATHTRTARRRALLRAMAAMPLLAYMPSAVRAQAAAGFRTLGASFGRVPAPADVRRVYAAGAPAGVLVYVLAPEKLLGWPFRLRDDARAWLRPDARDLPMLGRLAGRGTTVPVESLLQLQPDLVLDAGTVDATYTSAMERVSAQTGLPCVLIQGRLTEHAQQLRDVGRLLDAAERGDRLAAWADETLQRAAERRATLPLEQRPRVYLGRGVDGLETGLDGSINMEVIEAAGGRNVAAAAGKGSLTRVSLEQLIAWDPEVIVTQDAVFAQRVRTDPLWRSISAVRNRRVYCAPNLPFGWLDGPPGVNRLIGVRWLLTRLHERERDVAAAERELKAHAAEFYRLYYGSEFEPEALDRLLADA